MSQFHGYLRQIPQICFSDPQNPLLVQVSQVNKRNKMTGVLFSAPTQLKETLVRDCGLQQYLAADNKHKMCIKTYVTDLHENLATPNCLLLLCCITKINPTALEIT